MTIYDMDYVRSRITEDDIKRFKPTYLMIKEHTETGLKYFCKTVGKNPLKYKGSGEYWKNHIGIHGKDKVITTWHQLFDDIYELVSYALNFSVENDIVNARDENGKKVWANLMHENGLTGFAPGKTMSEQHKQMLRELFTDVPRSDQDKAKISAGMPDQSGENNGFYGKTHSAENKVIMGDVNRGKDIKTATGKKSISDAQKELFKDPEYKKAKLKALHSRLGEKRSDAAREACRIAALKRIANTPLEVRSERGKKSAATVKARHIGEKKQRYIDANGKTRYRWIPIADQLPNS